MSSPLSIFTLLATLSLLLASIDPSFARNQNKLTIRKLCSKTDNNQLCMRLMTSNSRSLDEDYGSLIEVAIDLAYSKAQEIHQDLEYLIDDAQNHNMKDLYNSCSKNYYDVLKDLEKTKNLYRDGDYKKIEVQIKDAIEEVRSCKEQVKRRESESSNLDMANREFEFLCDIINVSAKYWKGDDNWKGKKN